MLWLIMMTDDLFVISYLIDVTQATLSVPSLSLSALSPQPQPTCDEVLLSRAVDTGQVAAVFPAVFLGVLPGVSAAEVSVAVAMELPPRVVAALCVYRCTGGLGRGKGQRLVSGKSMCEEKCGLFNHLTPTANRGNRTLALHRKRVGGFRATKRDVAIIF